MTSPHLIQRRRALFALGINPPPFTGLRIGLQIGALTHQQLSHPHSANPALAHAIDTVPRHHECPPV